jgi:hypothetical protein
MVMAVALGALTATALPPSHGSGRAEHLSVAEPALAAPAASPSPSPTAESSDAGSAVRLPAFGGDSGPAPPARAGSALLVPSVGLSVGVVDYSDCNGNTEMTRAYAVHFLCTPAAVTAFVGHNPGVFTPLLRTHAGDRVTYQHDGGAEVFAIGAAQRVSPQEAAADTQDGSYVHIVLATCAEPDSSAYWIYIATPVTSSTGTHGGQPPPAPPAGGGGSHPSPSPSPTPSPSNGGAGGILPLPLPTPPV